MEDKIELITQPERDTETPSEAETLKKLKRIVEEYSQKDHDHHNNSTRHDPEKLGDRPRHSSKQESEELEKREAEDESHEDEKPVAGEDITDQQDYLVGDEDKPEGKIPLDGHFSTQEVKYILQASKEGGLLKNDIDMRVLMHNDITGDKVVISSPDNDEVLSSNGREESPSESKETERH